jgi:hypothetical protein
VCAPHDRGAGYPALSFLPLYRKAEWLMAPAFPMAFVPSFQPVDIPICGPLCKLPEAWQHECYEFQEKPLILDLRGPQDTLFGTHLWESCSSWQALFFTGDSV